MFVRDQLVTLPIVHLLPGELHIARQPALISTVLGSCIAVCFYDSGNRTGAMCHAVLPRQNDDEGKKPFYYVDRAIDFMIAAMRNSPTSKGTISARLFGGASMLGCLNDPERNTVLAIGEKNIEEACNVLARHGFFVSTAHTGGTSGCKLLFNTATGKITYTVLDNPIHRNRRGR